MQKGITATPIASIDESNFKIKGQRILILWNRSYKNMGDELILLWTTRLLQKQGKDVVISAYNPKRIASFFSQFTDLKPITYLHEFPKGIRSFWKYFFTKRKNELEQYKNIDAIIIWWGEILTEESKNSYRYRNIALLPILKKLEHTPIYLMGGIQIPQKNSNLKLFKRLLSKTEHIYARDLESVENLKNFWYKNVSFFMDTSRFAYQRESIQKNCTKENKIALINLNKNWEKFFEDLLIECENLLSSWYTIKYVPISKWDNDTYNDIIFKEELEKKLLTHFETIDREENFKIFLEEVKNSNIVITSRLHFFLIASYLWVKTKVYPYQMKILKMKKIIQDYWILDQ